MKNSEATLMMAGHFKQNQDRISNTIKYLCYTIDLTYVHACGKALQDLAPTLHISMNACVVNACQEFGVRGLPDIRT